jgi:LL-diaminopimelate aminotransferase
MGKIEPSKKIRALPPYLFARINAIKSEAVAKKLDVIDLSMGNPDMPTPKHVIDRLCDTVLNHHRTHRYPQAKGMPRFRKAVTNWMQARFNVSLDPESEVVALIGSKEGVAHLCMSYLDPGDIALVCDPCYPVHFNGVVLAGAEVYSVPLLEKNKFLPELESIPEEIAKKAKIFFVNFPNNPTAAVVEDNTFIERLIAFCKKYEILLVYDNAYSEVVFEGYTAPSIFQFPGAKDIALEFHSFSKTFNMAGWRVGWACGAAKFLAPLEKFKSFLDYGVPTFIQLAAASALEGPQDCVKEQMKIYQRRMEKMVQG